MGVGLLESTGVVEFLQVKRLGVAVGELGEQSRAAIEQFGLDAIGSDLGTAVGDNASSLDAEHAQLVHDLAGVVEVLVRADRQDGHSGESGQIIELS